MNILIRPLTIEDAAVSYKWRNDPEVWKFTGSRPTKEITAEIERDWLKNSLGDKSKTRFAILVDGEYVGNVQLTDIVLNKTAEFHIFIGNTSFWGKGVSKEATYQILQYAKEVLNLHSVFLDVNKENLPAIKSYKKNGFVIANETKDSIRMVCEIQNLKPPMVSVFCMVYNHEKYISQAIEGFLMQKTNFTSVMVIGEDCSTDGSRNIILKYAKKYPGKFKLLLNDKNIGAHKNQEKVLKNCTGKYIAMCEGDDYWTDPLKLQKQVDFMENNSDYSLCFHKVKIYNEEVKTFQKDIITKTVNETTSEEDLALGNYIHTPSVVLRNDFNIPSWFDKVHLGDWSLYMLSIKGRKIFKFKEEMAVYRLHSKSIWSKLDQEKRNRLTRENVEILYKNLKISSNTKNILRKRLGLKVKKSLLKEILNKLKQKISRFA